MRVRVRLVKIAIEFVGKLCPGIVATYIRQKEPESIQTAVVASVVAVFQIICRNPIAGCLCNLLIPRYFRGKRIYSFPNMNISYSIYGANTIHHHS